MSAEFGAIPNHTTAQFRAALEFKNVMANLTAETLAQFTSPVIRSLKWAANSSVSRLDPRETPNSEKAMQANLAFPTRPLGKVKDGTKAHAAISAFCAMLTERGIAPPPAHTIAPSTILGAFGVTDLSVESLKAVVTTCKEALDTRRKTAEKPAAVANVLAAPAATPAATPAASTPAASTPAEPSVVTECKCGARGNWTKEAPFCQACGKRAFKQRPGRRPAAAAPATPAAAVGSVVNG